MERIMAMKSLMVIADPGGSELFYSDFLTSSLLCLEGISVTQNFSSRMPWNPRNATYGN